MKLREWRQAREWTQEFLAEALTRAGIPTSQVAISNWENGQRFPGPGMIIEIYSFTDGAVAPGDWYDLPPLAERAAA